MAWRIKTTDVPHGAGHLGVECAHSHVALLTARHLPNSWLSRATMQSSHNKDFSSPMSVVLRMWTAKTGHQNTSGHRKSVLITSNKARASPGLVALPLLEKLLTPQELLIPLMSLQHHSNRRMAQGAGESTAWRADNTSAEDMNSVLLGVANSHLNSSS